MELRHRKCTEFWQRKLEANQSDSQKLWRLVDDLLGRGRAASSSSIDVETFNQFFVDKVEKVRSIALPTHRRRRSHVRRLAFLFGNLYV